MNKIKWLLVITFFICITGCRKQEQKQVGSQGQKEAQKQLGIENKEENKEQDPIHELWVNISELSAQNKTNEIIRILSEAIENKDFEKHKPAILRDLLYRYLNNNNINTAKEKYLIIAGKNINIAEGAFGVIASHLQRNKKYDDLIKWCDTLLTMNFSSPVRMQILNFILESYRVKGDFKTVFSLFQRCMDELPEKQAVIIINETLYSMLNANQYKEIDSSLEIISKKFYDKSGVPKMVSVIRFWSLLNRNRIEEAGDILIGTIKIIGDGQATGELNSLVSKSVKMNKGTIGEQICKKAIDMESPKTRLFGNASVHWVMMAYQIKKPDLIMNRLSYLSARGSSTRDLLNTIQLVFYFIMEKGDNATRNSLLSLSQDIYDRSSDKKEKILAINLMLDGNFMLKNYEKALQIINKGGAVLKREKRETIIPKIEAHIALASGKKEEAIAKFRQFMEKIKDNDESVMDPMSGLSVSKEMILGLNAVRIGEIWVSLGNNDKAELAYKEAEDYYQKALKSEDEKSDKYKVIKERLEKLPKVK